MTAGRGIVHSERSNPILRQAGYGLHGIQSWIALPRDAEEAEPEFHHHPGSTLPEWEDGGVRFKLIAGTAWRRAAPVKVFSPILYVDLAFSASATLTIPDEHAERGLYVAEGEITIDGEVVPTGEMATLETGALPVVAAGDTGARVMLLGGAPLDGPRHLWWNFVSSSKERIEQAKADWRAMAMGHVAGDDEFIPLPEH